jgi:hypothetical protein
VLDSTFPLCSGTTFIEIAVYSTFRSFRKVLYACNFNLNAVLFKTWLKLLGITLVKDLSCWDLRVESHTTCIDLRKSYHTLNCLTYAFCEFSNGIVYFSNFVACSHS